MTLTSGFYNSINHDRQYYNDQVSRIFDGIIKDGIFASIGTAMVVTAAGGMNVNIGIGRAWFNGRWVNNDSIYPLPMPAASLELDRIDTVVLEIDNSDAVRAASYKVITGAAASTPTAPDYNTGITDTENVHRYPLADVYIHGVTTEGDGSISQSDITNRVGTDPCPFITGILETIEISNLLLQWESQFNDWFNTIENIMSGSTAGEVISAVTSHMQNYTLANANWVFVNQGDESYYFYVINNTTYISTVSNQEVLPGLNITKAQLEALQAANIIDGGQSSGQMILKAMGDVPTIDIPIRVLFRGIK